MSSQRRLLNAAIFGAALVMVQTETAHACACCTEPGQRLDLSDTMDTYAWGELQLLRFSPTAVLYSGPGFPDDIEGVVNPSSSPYRVRAAIRNAVAFELVDPTGKMGRVQFLLPRTLTKFEVDPRDSTSTPPNGPTLYKEWRLTGLARLGGMLAGAGSTATATLILHGNGNSCTSAMDFQRWTLVVKGKRIAFTFLGDFVR